MKFDEILKNHFDTDLANFVLQRSQCEKQKNVKFKYFLILQDALVEQLRLDGIYDVVSRRTTAIVTDGASNMRGTVTQI